MAKDKQLMLMVPGTKKQEEKLDFYQSLSVQGIYQTLNVMRKIKENSDNYPEFIFSSTALYMRQTAEIVKRSFSAAQLVFRDNLYAANADNLLYFLMHLDEIFGSLLLLSEQRPIQELTTRLTGKKIELIPSSCLCICWSSRQLWKTIDTGSGQLVQSWLP